MTIYDILLLIVTPGMILSLFYIFKGRGDYIYSGDIPHNPYPKIIFLYAARKVSGVLQESVDSVNESCQRLEFGNYDVKAVVSEEGRLKNAVLIVVPKDYTCKSRFKARDLNYALQFTPNDENVWVLHLDEDAKIIPQTVNGIIHYIKSGGNPIANGPTLFPYNGNILMLFVEAQRAWTYYWCKFQMDTGMVYWMNGSNMLIRSDIEHRVGWNFENCKFSEDTRFAYEATKRFGRIFGWHGGLTLESPPKNIISAIKQRMRWYWGGMLQLKYMPFTRLFRRMYSSFAWLCGFFLTLFLPLGLIVNELFGISVFKQSIFVIGGISVSGVLWLFRYQFGLWRNLSVCNLSIVRKVLLSLLIIPISIVVEFICTVPTISALLKPPKTFEITAKKEY